MDDRRFDAIAKALATGLPRRRALAGLLGGALAAALGGRRAGAAPPACVPGGACQKTADCCPTERCVGGVCAATPGGNASCAAAGCPPIADPCRVNVCNRQTGACEPVADPAKEGQACPGADPCFRSHSCRAGVCVGGDPVDCSVPPDACHTAGTCVAGGCAYPPLPCGSGEVCSGGQCVCASPLVRCGTACMACCPGGTTFPNDSFPGPGACCSGLASSSGGGPYECVCIPTSGGGGSGTCLNRPGGEGCCSGRCVTSGGLTGCDCSRTGELCNPVTQGGPPCCDGGTCVPLPGLVYAGRCAAP